MDWRSNLKLTGIESPCAKCTCLWLLGSCTEGCGGLRLCLTKSTGTRPESTGTCGCGAFKESAAKVRLKQDTRTESAASLLLAESRIACAENAPSLLLWLCGTECTSPEASRLLWLSLTECTKPSPGLQLRLLWLLLLLLLWLLLLLLLTERTESRSSCGASGTESTASPESRLSGLRRGLRLAKQASRCRWLCGRSKCASTESSGARRLAILLVVLQPEFLRRANGVRE